MSMTRIRQRTPTYPSPTSTRMGCRPRRTAVDRPWGPLGGCGLRRHDDHGRLRRYRSRFTDTSLRTETATVLSAEDCEDDNPLVGAGLEVVGTGSFHGCALDCAGTPHCWGIPIEDDRSEAPDVTLKSLSVGVYNLRLGPGRQRPTAGDPYPQTSAHPRVDHSDQYRRRFPHLWVATRQDHRVLGYNFDGRLDAPEESLRASPQVLIPLMPSMRLVRHSAGGSTTPTVQRSRRACCGPVSMQARS